MIHVIAILTAKPGKRGEALQALHDNLKAVHAEAGCIEYGPATDTDHEIASGTFGDDSFVVIEKWESKSALSAHARSAHMATYGANTKDLLASRVIHVLETA